MKRLLLFLLSSWLVVMGIFAQQMEYKVVGKVETAEGESLPGANVKLTNVKHHHRMSGAATDVDGQFTITVEDGLYQLEISYIGYAPYVSNVEVKGNVTLPVIALQEDTQQMDAVVITARTVTYHSNGYIADISKNPFYRNQDMSTILRMTPGTRVTHQGLEAYGKGISKIYLNGRELHLDGQQLLSYLQTIEGKNVKQMEVVASSGVEEDAASAGQSILKITTFNPETGGMFSIGGNGHYRSFSHLYGGNTNVQWRINKRWGMYASLSRNETVTKTGTRDEIHFYETGDKRINEMENHTENTTYMATFGVTYDWNANNLFSLEGVCGSMANNNKQWENIRHWNDGAYRNMSRGSSAGEDDRDYLNLSFLYLRKFGKNGELNFKAETYMRKDKEVDARLYDYASNERQETNRVNDEDNRSYLLRADYTHHFPSVKGKLAAGLKADWLKNDNYNDNQLWKNEQPDEYGSYTDNYLYKEKVYAAYAKYSFSWSKFSFNAGMRVEHSILSPQSQSNPERNVESDYTDIFPEVGVSYTINKEKGHHTGFSYQKGIQRPYMGALNPKVIRQGEYSYSMGNPMLRPYNQHNFSLNTHLFHQYIIRLTYDCSDGGFLQLGESRDGVLYTSNYNGGKSSSFGVYASIPVEIGRNVRLTFSGKYSYNHTSYGSDEREYGHWNVGCSGMFKLPAGFQLMADFSYIPPTKSLYGKTYWYPYANLILTKPFLKGKLNASLMAGDLFNSTSNQHRKYHYNTYYQDTRGTKRGPGITLNLRYNIRWGQKSNVRQAGSSNGGGRF